MHNGQGLLLCWHLCSSSPEPLRIENMQMKLTTKSQIEFRRLGVLLIVNKKMRFYSSASNLSAGADSSKPHVVRSAFLSVSCVVCRGKICKLKQAIQLVLSRYYILRISYDVLESPWHHKIRNANYLFSSQHNVSSSMLPILDSHCDNSHAFVCVCAQKQTVLIQILQWQKVLKAVLPYFSFDLYN